MLEVGTKVATRIFVAVGALAATLAAAGPTVMVSQEPVIIPDEVSCKACSIALEHVTTLRPNPEDGFFCSEGTIVTAGGPNRFYAIDALCPDPVVLVFNRDGQRVDILGRRGQGPGELTRPRAIFTGLDGSLYVFEPRKVSVFSPTGTFVRSTAFPTLPGGFALASDGTAVIAASITTPQRVGFPLHTVDESGRVLRSFGGDNEAYSSADSVLHASTVATAGDPGLIWSGRLRAYEIEEWDAQSGTRLRRIKRDAPWFDESLQEYGTDGARLRRLREDEQGLLWTIVNVQTMPFDPTSQSVPVVDDLFDTVFEVIDPERGEMIAARRDERFFFVWAGPLTFSVHEDEELNIIVDVWRVSLQGRHN